MRCFAACLALLPVLLGCANDGPEIADVSGRVTYQGQPLANAKVLFSPEDGGRVAAGTTDAEGRYVLGTFDVADGAIVGLHRVSISARGPGKALPADAQSGLIGSTQAPGDPLIPEKYFLPETSGLAKQVASGSNEFNFEL